MLVSLTYLFFLSIVLIIFYNSPTSWRLILLLIASLFFLGFYHFYSVLFLLGLTTFTLFIGKLLQDSVEKKVVSKTIFYFGLSVHLFFLFGLKYIEINAQGLGLNIDSGTFQTHTFFVALGISFYTLQNISYLIEIYLGRIKEEKNYLAFFTYNAFFPKLISGPIEPTRSFLPQLKSLDISFDWGNFNYGIQRIFIGFFKKMVLSDRLLPLVENTFGLETPATGLTCWVGICLFTLQLYFDFSGYMDIALGSARLFGLKLSENFNYPLRATSIADFWRKWHITLLNWLTQYLYYPIVYRFRQWKKVSVIFALTVVFLLSGIWHGIGWTFLMWSLCHIIYLSVEVITKSYRVKLSQKTPSGFYTFFSIFITFNLVCLGQLFFRASSLENIISLLKRVFSFPILEHRTFFVYLAGGGTQEHMFNIYSTFILVALFLFFEKRICEHFFSEDLKIFSLFLGILLLLIFGIFNSGAQFIYLQF